jgi:group I intron endonuclease
MSTNTYNTGIYVILNKISKHFYPGSAVDLNDRWEIHKSKLNHNKHHCNHLQNAWNKYGPDAFTFLHIEYTTLDALTPVWSEKHQCKVILPEQFWLDKYWGTGLLYNTCPIAGSPKGRKDLEKTKKKKSESHMNHIVTEETKNKIGKSNKGKQYALGSKRSENKKRILEMDILLLGKLPIQVVKLKLLKIWLNFVEKIIYNMVQCV